MKKMSFIILVLMGLLLPGNTYPGEFPGTASGDDLNQLIGIRGNVQEQIDTLSAAIGSGVAGLSVYSTLAELEAIDGATVTNGYGALVITSALNWYWYISTTNGTESSTIIPRVIVPSTNPGSGPSSYVNWKMQLWIKDGKIKISNIAAAMQGITDPSTTLTAEQMNSVIVMTGAGDVTIPVDQCDTATFQWLTVKSSETHLNSIASNDAADRFILSNGTLLSLGNELDLAGTIGAQVTIMCLTANRWWVIGEIGTCEDGEAAD